MNLAYDDCLMMDEELIHGQKNTLQNRPSMSRILVGTASASLSEPFGNCHFNLSLPWSAILAKRELLNKVKLLGLVNGTSKLRIHCTRCKTNRMSTRS